MFVLPQAVRFRLNDWGNRHSLSFGGESKENVGIGKTIDVDQRPGQPLPTLLDAQLPLRDGQFLDVGPTEELPRVAQPAGRELQVPEGDRRADRKRSQTTGQRITNERRCTSSASRS